MLEELNQNTPDIETAPAVEVKKKKEAVLFLEELEDVNPCDSLGELERQRNLALMSDAEAIRATDKVMKYFLRNAFDKTKVEPGYMIYKNIRVYFEEIKEDKSDFQDIESKLFKK